MGIHSYSNIGSVTKVVTIPNCKGVPFSQYKNIMMIRLVKSKRKCPPPSKGSTNLEMIIFMN